MSAPAGDLFAAPSRRRCRSATALARLKPLLEDPAVLKIGQNVKAPSSSSPGTASRLAPIDDTMLISYALHAGLHGHGLDELAEQLSRPPPLALKSLTGGGKAALTLRASSPVEEARRLRRRARRDHLAALGRR